MNGLSIAYKGTTDYLVQSDLAAIMYDMYNAHVMKYTHLAKRILA